LKGLTQALRAQNYLRTMSSNVLGPSCLKIKAKLTIVIIINEK